MSLSNHLENSKRGVQISSRALDQKRQRKMVLSGHDIKSHVIYAYFPSNSESSRHIFPFFILNNVDPKFFWHHLGEVDPSAIKYKIYNSNLKKLQCLLSNYLLHVWVEPPLWLTNWVGFIFQICDGCKLRGCSPLNPICSILFRPYDPSKHQAVSPLAA